MTREQLEEVAKKFLIEVGKGVENPEAKLTVETEEDLIQAFAGALRSLYNKGIQDAVDAIQLNSVIRDIHEVLTPDHEEDYFLNIDNDGDIEVGETQIKTRYIRINKEEVLKLKVK